MKVFISWSGEYSRKVAIILKEWLPLVIQTLEPYVSSEDIRKGSRWSNDIGKELEETTYGIICLTKENINSPWVNFEAGALSKAIGNSFVSPFLFGLKGSDIDSSSPLLQFQYTLYNKEDIKKLVDSIYESTGSNSIDGQRLTKTFETWWPELEEQLNDLLNQESNYIMNSQTEINTPESESVKILEELLELARNQQKIISSPENILPPGYLADILELRGFKIDPRVVSVVMSLQRNVGALDKIIENLIKDDEINKGALLEDLMSLGKNLNKDIRYLQKVISTKNNLRISKSFNDEIII